jgi:hypothetical protein
MIIHMKTLKPAAVLDQLVAPLADCLTPESARRLLALKADPELQARVDDLAARHSRGELTAEEHAEYGRYVSYSTFVAKTQKTHTLIREAGKSGSFVKTLPKPPILPPQSLCLLAAS